MRNKLFHIAAAVVIGLALAALEFVPSQQQNSLPPKPDGAPAPVAPLAEPTRNTLPTLTKIGEVEILTVGVAIRQDDKGTYTFSYDFADPRPPGERLFGIVNWEKEAIRLPVTGGKEPTFIMLLPEKRINMMFNPDPLKNTWGIRMAPRDTK